MRKPKFKKTYLVGNHVTIDVYYKEGDIKGTYLVIHDEQDLLRLRVSGNTETYGMILAGIENGFSDVVDYFVCLLYALGLNSMTDSLLFNKFINCWHEYLDSKQTEAKERASKITATDETISQAVMESLIRPHDSKDFKVEVKEVLKDENIFKEDE